MPNGAAAPGKVFPKFCVPTNGLTSASGSSTAAAPAGAATSPLAASAASTSVVRLRRAVLMTPPDDNVVRARRATCCTLCTPVRPPDPCEQPGTSGRNWEGLTKSGQGSPDFVAPHRTVFSLVRGLGRRHENARHAAGQGKNQGLSTAGTVSCHGEDHGAAGGRRGAAHRPRGHPQPPPFGRT